MNRWSVRAKANGILAISAAGLLAAFPFQHSFVGGLLFAALSAGTIGGLADSFAINALFGDPLRINWPKWMGTHIISRNRERLIGELVDMVEKELLTVPSIRSTLQEHDIGAVIIRYLTEHGGSEEVHAIAQKLAAELLTKADADELATGIHRFMMNHADALQVSDLLADIGDWTIRNGYDDRIVTFMVQPFIKLVKTTQFRIVIEQVAQSAIRSYEGDKFRRRLVDYTAGLSAYAISGKVQNWLVSFLEQFGSEEHPQRKRLKDILTAFIRKLREDEAFRLRIEAGKLKLFESVKDHLQLDEFIRKRLTTLRETIVSSARGEEADKIAPLRWLKEEIDNGIEGLAASPELSKSLDEGVKSVLLNWLEEKHAFIGRMVREKLESFSEQELIALVKEKAGRDLQYIRLNGMIVGAIVGIILYLLTFWIGGG